MSFHTPQPAAGAAAVLRRDGDARPQTEPHRPSERWSRALWGIDWDELLPVAFANGFVAAASSLDAAAPFIRDHYAQIFHEPSTGSAFSTSRLGAAKARYYAFAGDFFEFRRGDGVAGILICTPIDWSSYYVRSAALLPEYQGSQVIQNFLVRVVFPALAAAGVERVELDASPSNLAMMHIATRMRFNATGTLLSDRWGAAARFTKFLDPDAERVFLRQFCSGVEYQLRSRDAAHDTPR